MSQESYSLKLVGYSESEKDTIHSVLSLAERGLFKKWRIVEAPPVDYFLLPGDLLSQIDHDEVLKTLPKDRCIFSSKEEPDSAARSMQLYVDSRNVPRIRSLIDLLNRLGEHSGSLPQNLELQISAPAQTLESSVVTGVDDQNRYNPRQGFVGQLLGCGNQTGLLFYTLNGDVSLGPIYVEPGKQLVYSSTTIANLLPFFNAGDQDISCNSMPDVSTGRIDELIETQGLNPYTLRSLIWYGVFKSSGERLMQGSSPEDVVRLRHWPDLNFPEYQELVKIAAFMQSNAVNLAGISEKTGVPLGQIYNFYNACEIVGLIEHTSETDIHSKELHPEKVGLIAKIRDRLNKGN